MERACQACLQLEERDASYLPYVPAKMYDHLMGPQELMRTTDAVLAMKTSANSWMSVVYGQLDREGAELMDQHMNRTLRCTTDKEPSKGVLVLRGLQHSLDIWTTHSKV